VSVPVSRETIRLRFSDARPDDAPVIAGLQNAASGALVARFGDGHWGSLVTERGVAHPREHARTRVGKIGKRIVTVLRLGARKPWAIDVAYFTPVDRPLYLTGMAVAVALQGRGVGRRALAAAEAGARDWDAPASRRDADDAPAGGGGFYAACGYADRGRVTYRNTPLAYYERLLG
jgi:GNAT superfamily N-acetyltransferase